MRSDLKFLIFSLAAMALSFGLGFLLGTNFPRQGSSPTTNNDPFNQLITTAKPEFGHIQLLYKGSLSELSPQKIALVNDQGQTITLALDALGTLTVPVIYRKRLPDSSQTQNADRSIFTPGTRISLDLVANFTANQVKIISITLVKDQ